MRRIKLTIEYEGTNYVGWQIQPNGIAIQQKLHEALKNLFNEEILVTASGRTDSGVHALCQVVHFDINSNLPNFKIIRGLNFYLPDDIKVINAEDAASDFHARYDAVKRTYRYYIRLQPTSVLRNFRWVIIDKINIDEMIKAEGFLKGKKNFKSFCSSQSNMDHYNCELLKAEFSLMKNDLIFEIQANRFLHNMVRSIVGTLVEIGRGKFKAEDIKDIIAQQNRVAAGPTAPPTGLFLEKVDY